MVKNAVIIPTGAKGGFYPKQLPAPQWIVDAWISGAAGLQGLHRLPAGRHNLAVGTDGSRLLSAPRAFQHATLTTTTWSLQRIRAPSILRHHAISLERGFWLGDAFASAAPSATTTRLWASPHAVPESLSVTSLSSAICSDRRVLQLATCPVTCSVTVCSAQGNPPGRSIDHHDIFLVEPERRCPSMSSACTTCPVPHRDYNRDLISAGGGETRGLKSIEITPRCARFLDPGRVRPETGTDRADFPQS